jgi:hypothetical protein
LTGFKKTISVNEDPFFSAPVQTPECRSPNGIWPDTSACWPDKSADTPVARTSPYDYVTTVIQPACAVTNKDPNLRCGSQLNGKGGTWSRDCGGPFCTGVRLYRQYLTDGSQQNEREWQD